MEIENFAVSKGHTPRIDPDSTRHPGSECNRYLRDIMSDPIAAKRLGIKSSDYFQVDVMDCIGNRAFVEWMISSKFVAPQAVKDGRLDIYTMNAARIIVSMMLQRPEVIRIEELEIDERANIFNVRLKPKSLDKKKPSWQKSLLRAKISDFKVIDTFTPEEQEVIRRYNQKVKQTRDTGRKYTKRGVQK